MAFTIKDLARKLGVSPSTVSRALHDHPDISDATKARVVEAASRYHYHPNQIAKNLQMCRTTTVGVLVPEIRHNFFSTVISGVEEVAYKAGYSIMVCQSAETLRREIINTQAMVAHRVAGLIIAISTETTTFDHLCRLMKQGIPLVQFDRVVEELDTGKVVVDDFAAAYGATTHLIERGYRHIGHLSGSRGIALNRHRYGGFMKAMADHGLHVDPADVVYLGYQENDGRAGAEAFLKRGNMPEAILAINDPVAVGAYARLKEAGVRIPQEVALVGFSDTPAAALIEPPLTTVYQPAREMGRTAFGLLLQELEAGEGAFAHQTVVLPTKLIVRGST